MTVSPQLEKRLIDLGFVVVGGLTVWYLTQKIGIHLQKTASKKDTQPVGELLSDLTAGLNGWEAVELPPRFVTAI
ncbi:hypothetical protein O9993_05125 [Vibrio lentus]|nr:hypothetical protein [Vibrio lentus]